MRLDSGEVDLRDVMEWATEQSKYLASPGDRLVLWYLCLHAFRYENNPEHRVVGAVLSRYASLSRIALGTGLSVTSVRNSLQRLQEQAYIFAQHRPGNGRSEILVFWSGASDDNREAFRQGVKKYPDWTRDRSPKAKPKRALATVRSIHSGE